MNNTRKYPRTLVEAFGPDAIEANPIRCMHRPSTAERVADVALAVSIGLALAWGAYHYFT